MGDNITKRLITSFLILGVVFSIIFLMPGWVFCTLTVIFIIIALNEFFSIVEKKGYVVYKYFGIVAGSIIPVAIYLHVGEGIANLEPFFIVIACLFTFVLQFIRRDTAKDHLLSAALTLFALFYISWLFSFFIKIKYLPDGAMLVTFLILVTKISDVGAYFFGKKFGKRPLIPRISPKKTKEGSTVGLISSILMAILCRGLMPDTPLLHIVFLGFLLGIVGEVGDLAESLLKRDFDVKDSSKNLPGLGGVLDVVDSLLFTAPIYYFYIIIVLRPL